MIRMAGNGSDSLARVTWAPDDPSRGMSRCLALVALQARAGGTAHPAACSCSVPPLLLCHALRLCCARLGGARLPSDSDTAGLPLPVKPRRWAQLPPWLFGQERPAAYSCSSNYGQDNRRSQSARHTYGPSAPKLGQTLGQQDTGLAAHTPCPPAHTLAPGPQRTRVRSATHTSCRRSHARPAVGAHWLGLGQRAAGN